MEESVGNRWAILAASMLCNLIIGAGYCWSLYQVQLLAIFDWTPAQVSLTFTLVLIASPVTMSLVGKLQEKTGPRKMMMAGGFLCGLGVFLAGYTKSLAYLYLVYGVVNGVGLGLIYAVAITNTVKWFPDKRGLSSGLITAALAAGSVVFAPIASILLKHYGVLSVFQIMAVIYFALIMLGTFFIKAPPDGYMRQVPDAPGRASLAAEKDWKQMLSDPIFYVLYIMFTMGLVSGLMVLAHVAPIGQQTAHLSVEMSAAAVAVLSAGNTLGRFVWGFISDKIGRYLTLFIIYLISAGSMYYLVQASSVTAFMLTIVLIGLSYGGLLGVFPAVTADMFGLKNMGTNYGIMVSASSVAAVIGPQLAARVLESSGGVYDQAFIIASVMGLIGAVLVAAVMLYLKKRITLNRLTDSY